MREILFRALPEDCSAFGFDFVVGSYLNHSGRHEILVKISDKLLDYEIVPVRPETVGQFTGLLDKNGNRIFEGDTVRWGMGCEILTRHAVVQMNPDIQFRITHYVNENSKEQKEGDLYIFRFGSFIYTDTKKYLEITGNIHDPATP